MEQRRSQLAGDGQTDRQTDRQADRMGRGGGRLQLQPAANCQLGSLRNQATDPFQTSETHRQPPRPPRRPRRRGDHPDNDDDHATLPRFPASSGPTLVHPRPLTSRGARFPHSMGFRTVVQYVVGSTVRCK
jgi:hypothetical protein